MTCDHPRIWIDTTTLHRTFRHGPARVTGIPRVVCECIREARLDKVLRDRIRFCCASEANWSISEISFEDVDRLIALTEADLVYKASFRDRLKGILTPRVIERLSRLEELLRRTMGKLRGRYRKLNSNTASSHPFGVGDVWVNLGCWWHESLPDLMKDIRQYTEIRTVVAIHDCMPLALPEHFPAEQVRLWENGTEALQSSTDEILAVSENTKRDVRRYLPKFRGEISRFRLGDNFLRYPVQNADQSDLQRLGIDEPYVLMVGTIEARKNHILVVRTWRELLRSGVSLPKLVFAGKWGWKIDELFDEVSGLRSEGDHLRIIEGPTDSELAALYHGALFTVFPSKYEGWGLPVRESLFYGRVCIAAHNSSIIEASDGLADEFESGSQSDLARLVLKYLDPGKRSEREAEIESKFEVTGWDKTWSEIRAVLQRETPPGHS